MAEPHVLSALKAKRAEIAGLIDHHQQAINQARVDLTHIDATLRIFGYAEDPGAIPAKRSVTPTSSAEASCNGRSSQDGPGRHELY